MRGRWRFINSKLMPVLLLAAMCSRLAFGQGACTVQEEQRWLTLSAHFSISPVTVNVTLPWPLFQHDPVTVFLEVSPDTPTDSPPLFMETDGERVAVANGAALHLAPTVHQRIIFTLSGEDGQSLCTWRPAVRIWAQGPPQVEDGFRSFYYSPIRTAGDPIYLQVGGKLASGSGSLRIDGLDAVVLARSSGA